MADIAPLTDELMLLGYDDETGKRAGVSSIDLPIGLAGAVLVELSLAERLAVKDKRVVVLNASPTGDPIADGALAQIAASGRERTAKAWVGRLKRKIDGRVLDGLAAQGILRCEQHRVFGIFPSPRYPTQNPQIESEIRQRLNAAVLQGQTPDERTAALVGLIGACNMRKAVFGTENRREVNARIKEISDGDWAADAVKRAIAEVHAAIASAAATSSVAATTAATSA